MAYFVDSSYFEKYALSMINANGALEAVSVLWWYGVHVSVVVDCFVVVVDFSLFLPLFLSPSLAHCLCGFAFIASWFYYKFYKLYQFLFRFDFKVYIDRSFKMQKRIFKFLRQFRFWLMFLLLLSSICSFLFLFFFVFYYKRPCKT